MCNAPKRKVLGFHDDGIIWARLECGHLVVATDARGCSVEKIEDAEQQVGAEHYCFYCSGDSAVESDGVTAYDQMSDHERHRQGLC